MKLLKGLFIILFLLVLNGCKESLVEDAKEYEIKFLVDGEIYDLKKYQEGSEVVYPLEPVKEGYVFLGWDKEISVITKNEEVNAVFELEEYVVKFLVDGEILEVKQVKHGENVNVEREPEKDGYTFKGWDKELNNITSDLEINALFEINIFKVVFLVDGDEYYSVEVEYGESIIEPKNPKKEGYDFLGWDKTIDIVTSNLEINAIFEESKPQPKEILKAVEKEIEEYFSSLKLPLTNDYIYLKESYDNVIITWESSNENIISLDGEITRPFTSKKFETVIISCGIKVENEKVNKKYTISVKRGYKNLEDGINAAYDSGAKLTDLAIQTYDIVYYSFLYMSQDTTGNLKNPTAVKNGINNYKDKLHEAGGRALFSFVSQNTTDKTNLKLIIEDDAKLETLVNNLLKFCVENDLDGIDIDWETPGSSGGAAYTKFIKKVYETFKSFNPEYIITSAIGAGPWQYKYYNLEESAKYHDYINMMSYGMQTGTTSSFQNALYFKKSVCLKECSIDTTLDIYNSVGIKNSQIIVGVPFFGRVFSETDGLGKSCSGNVAVKQNVIFDYLNNGFNEYFDEDCKVPYLYNSSTRQFVTYENTRSILIKWKYINDKKLAGMMCWNYTQDYNDTLTRAMNNGKNDRKN